MSTRRELLIGLGTSALATPFASLARQQAANVPRIAYLSLGSRASNGAFLGAFRDGLREFGYIDGENIIIDVRWAGTAADELPELAASLVKTKPNVIVGTCIPSTRAAKNATAAIPVVMSVNGDPVAAGLVTSLARPGGNVTGTLTLFEELIPKWLELVREAVPDARTMAVLANPENLSDLYWWTQAEKIARKADVELVRAEASRPAELDSAFAAIKQQRANALIVMCDPFLAGQIQRIVTLSGLYQLPAIYGFREFAKAGGLMSYGISFRDYYRNVARYVDKVLKGTRPADLPVDQPTKIELVINVATAKKLDVKISQRLLMRADSLIE